MRRQRVLTNVSSLVDMGVVPLLLDSTDYVLMSDSLHYWKPETHQESLLCAEAPTWRRVCKRERDALFEPQVMRVVRTPPDMYTSVSTIRMVQSRSIRHD